MRQITEKIVTFETAKVAANVGFSCFSEEQLKGVYCMVSSWYEVATGKLWEDHEDGIRINYNEKGTYKKWETIIEAPSQSVLQKWLRDKWHVHPHIWFDDEMVEEEPAEWRASIYLLAHDSKQGGLVSKPVLGVGCRTYEERLELALQEMLYFVQLDCPVKRSSQEWQKMYPDPFVVDPDGWDRSNFEESWQEPITYKEYVKRLINSTCKFSGAWGKKIVKA